MKFAEINYFKIDLKKKHERIYSFKFKNKKIKF